MKRVKDCQGLSHPVAKRQATKTKEDTSTCQCSNCAFTWKKSDTSTTHFELKCNGQHTLCPLCFSSLMASKGSMHFFHCPACKDKEKLTEWKVFTPQQTRQGRIRQKAATHSLAKPDLDLQPVLHHHATTIMTKRKESTTSSVATLSLSTTKTDKKGNEALRALSLQINTVNIESTINKENRKKLTTIFQLLHPVLVSTSKKEFHRKYYDESFSCQNANEHLFEMASLDTTCLFQCVYALATGKVSNSDSSFCST